MKPRQPMAPALRRMLDEQATAVASSGMALPTTSEARVRFTRAMMVRAVEGRTSILGLPNNVEARDVDIARGLSARLYTPSGAARPAPVLVYLHGGGWVAGSVATLDPFCRLLSEASGVIVVSVEYRLAPEAPFPAGLDDADTAVQWAFETASSWGGDASRIAVGGDSAGANLAAVTANRLCAAIPATKLRAQMLLYPITDHPSAGHSSYTENATGYGLEAEVMRWFWQQYAPGAAADDARTSPLRIDPVPPLPPTLIATAEYDVLRDEGIAYAEKLAAAGIAVTHVHSPDMNHNFSATPGTVARFEQSVETLTEIADWLRSAMRDGA